MSEYENVPVFDDNGNIVTEIKRPIIHSGGIIMNELEILMAELLELAKNNPDLLFKITPNEDRTQWIVEFTKGGYWWAAWPEGDETLSDAIKEALPYFESLTDQAMMDKIQKEWKEAEG